MTQFENLKARIEKLPFPFHSKSGEGGTFIQWKGTDVCMDWYCPVCGKQNHEDGDFMYEVECRDDQFGDCFENGEAVLEKGCGAVFITGTEIELFPLDTQKYKRWKEE